MHCTYIKIPNAFVIMSLGYKYQQCNKYLRFYNSSICKICEIFSINHMSLKKNIFSLFMSACYESLFPTDMWSNTTLFFRVQERVLPCVQNSIENNSLRSPSDWFFSMTFDFEMAKRTSIAMCKKLKSIKSDNLQTIHSQIFNVYPLCPSSQSYINWIKIKWIIKSLFSHLTLL